MSQHEVRLATGEGLLSRKDAEKFVIGDKLQGWLSDYTEETGAFQSVALHVDLRLSEAIRQTQGLETPNEVRTQVAAELLLQVVQSLGRYRPLMRRLLRELYSAIYLNPKSDSPVAYFTRYAETLQELERLRASKDGTEKALNGIQNAAESRLRMVERMLARWRGQALQSAFYDWRDLVRADKRKREQIKKVLAKWQSTDAARALLLWKQWAAEQKTARARRAAEAVSRSHDDLKNQLLKLQQRLREEEEGRAAERKRAEGLEIELEELRRKLAEAEARANAPAPAPTGMSKAARAVYVKSILGLARGQLAELHVRQSRIYVHNPHSLLLELMSELKLSEQRELLHAASEDDVLLAWTNCELRRQGARLISNFGGDMRSGRELIMLAHALCPERCGLSLLSEVDPLIVAQSALLSLQGIFGLPAECLTAEELISGEHPDKMAAVLCHLFQHVRLPDGPKDVTASAAISALSQGIDAFDRDSEEGANMMNNINQGPRMLFEDSFAATEHLLRISDDSNRSRAKSVTDESVSGNESIASSATTASRGRHRRSSSVGTEPASVSTSKPRRRRNSVVTTSASSTPSNARAHRGSVGKIKQAILDAAMAEQQSHQLPPRHEPASLNPTPLGTPEKQPGPAGDEQESGEELDPAQVMLRSETAERALRAAEEQRAERDEVLRELKLRLQKRGTTILAKRMYEGSEEPVMLTEAISEADNDGMADVHLSHIADVLPIGDLDTPGLAEELGGMLKKEHRNLKRIYKYYALGGCMSNSEFQKFAKDCRIFNKDFTSAKLDLIFMVANKAKDGDEGSTTAFVNNPDKELTTAEFGEALIRVAIGRFNKSGSSKARLNKMLKDHVLPYAMLCESDHLRQQLALPEVREVMVRHRPNMRQLYNKYAVEDVSLEGKLHAATMNIREVEMMFKEAQLLQAGTNITAQTLRFIFGTVQDTEGADDDETELNFPEFVEFMGAAAMWRDPNPFIPYHKRLDSFLTHHVFAPLRASKKFKPVQAPGTE